MPDNKIRPIFDYIPFHFRNSSSFFIFSTVTNGMGAGFMAMAMLNRLYLTLINDQAGTLKSYSSENRGTTWTQISSTAVAASAANSENPYDYLIEPYSDWKLEWVNGATPQTTFRVAAALQGQRNPPLFYFFGPL